MVVIARVAVAPKPKKKTKKKAEKPVAIVQPHTGEKKELPRKSIDLYRDSVFLIIGFGIPGNKRNVDMDNVDIHFRQIAKDEKGDADKNMLNLQRQLLDSPELEEIRKFDEKARKFLYSLTLSSPLNKGGIYLIPLTLAERAEKFLEDMKKSRQYLIDKFMAAYPARKEQAKKSLKSAFDESCYPSESGMRSKFKMDWSFRTLGLQEGLKTVSQFLYDREAKKIAEEMKDLVPQIANSLRVGLRESLHRFCVALTPHEDGRRRRLYDTNAESLLQFLNTFGDKNIVGDTDCASLVEQAKKLVRNRDAGRITEMCRDDDDFREQMLKGFKDIAQQVEALEIDESREITW